MTELTQRQITDKFIAAVDAGNLPEAVKRIMQGADVQPCITDTTTRKAVDKASRELGLGSISGATEAADAILNANMKVNVLKLA